MTSNNDQKSGTAADAIVRSDQRLGCVSRDLELPEQTVGPTNVAGGVGSSRALSRPTGREGPKLACVQTPLRRSGVVHAGDEGRINVLPWYRQVDVAKYLQ